LKGLRPFKTQLLPLSFEGEGDKRGEVEMEMGREAK